LYLNAGMAFPFRTVGVARLYYMVESSVRRAYSTLNSASTRIWIRRIGATTMKGSAKDPGDVPEPYGSKGEVRSCAPRLVRNAVPLVAGTPPTLRSRPSGRRKGPPCSPRHRTASPGYRRDELKTTCRVRYQRKLTVRPGTMRDHITSQPEFRRSSRSEVPSEEPRSAPPAAWSTSAERT
jgi:hypothetical protein